jgi:uncharacterized protein
MVSSELEFEWDLAKADSNQRKHGVDFVQAAECFQDPAAFVLTDAKHSEVEKRYFLVGKNRAGQVLTVRYARRGNRIRIFGAAEWRRFRELYDERTKPK